MSIATYIFHKYITFTCCYSTLIIININRLYNKKYSRLKKNKCMEIVRNNLNLYESFIVTYTYVELSSFINEMLFIIRIAVQWRLKVLRNII